MKRFGRIITAVMALCTAVNLFAAVSVSAIGAKAYPIDLRAYDSLTQAEADGKEVQFSAGGTAQYTFYLPFDCKGATIQYTANSNSGAELTVGKLSAQAPLPADQSSVDLYFSKMLRYGERTLTFRAKSDVRVTGLVLNRADRDSASLSMPDLSLTEYEELFQDSVMLDTNASIIIVNGQRRYINTEDVRQIPANIDGSIYLPVHTLARALGYYYESIPEKSYVLMRHGDMEWVYLEGQAWAQQADQEKVEMPFVIRYLEGEAYAPVRYFAELIGEMVGYSEDFIIIDKKHIVNSVLNTTKYRQYAKGRFAEFYPQNGESGAVYYVAQTENASDDNAGSADMPFRTLEKAGRVAKAGDTVIIREGVYRETFIPENDGTATAPIIFQAADGEEVVIAATEKVSGFLPYDADAGIYTAGVGWDLGDGRNMVMLDGTALVEARYPNGPGLKMSENSEQLSPLFPTVGDFRVNGENFSHTVTSQTLLDQPDGYWVGGTYVGMHGLGWTLSTGKIDTSTQGSFTVKDLAKAWWYDGLPTDKVQYGFITGHIHALDAPGEWIMQDNALLLIPPEGADPSTMQVEVKKRQLVFDIADRKFVQLKGIKTFGGGARMNNSEMCMLDNMEMKYISHYIHGLDQRNGFIKTGNDLNYDDAPPQGEVGIYVGGTDNIIVDSVIDHSAAAGIYAVGKYMYAENNVVKNCGYASSYISGITFMIMAWEGREVPKGGFALYNNEVYNSGRSVMNLQATSSAEGGAILPFEMAYNDFHDGVLASLDTGITYEFHVYSETDQVQSQMHHNYVYYTGAETNSYSFAIYHDGGSAGIDTFNNMVFTTQPGVIFSQLYVQNAQKSINHWNNGQIKKAIGGRPDHLKQNDFPHGRPFYAGVINPENPYLVNYERVKSGIEDYTFYKAKDAEVSEGVTIDDEECAVFTQAGQSVTFKDVDFGEKGSNINIQYHADRYVTNDCINISVGKDGQTAADLNNLYVVSYVKDEDMDDLYSIGIPEVSGLQDVTITIQSPRSMRIRGITVNDRGVVNDSHDGRKVYGGEFNNIQAAGSASMPPRAVGMTEGSFCRDTWPGTILRYNNVNIEEDAKYIVVCQGTEPAHSGQPVTFSFNKRGDATNTAVYTYTTHPRNNWDNEVPDYGELEVTIPAGVYDIYVAFDSNNQESGGTCNFKYFGFLPELPQESE